MVLGPKSKKQLLDFSLRLAKLPSTQPPIDNQTRADVVQAEWLAGEGLDVITELMQNSTKSIDASSGSSAFAPAEKIEADLLKVNSADLPEYHNHLPQDDLVKAAQKYFQQIGVLGNTATLKQDIYDKNASATDTFSVIGHGTTHLFTSSLKSLIVTDGDVIIATQPSYGLFLGPIVKAGGVLAPLALNEQYKYKPNPQALKQLIISTNASLKENYSKKVSLLKTLFIGASSQLKLSQAEKEHFQKLFAAIFSSLKEKNNHDFKKLDSAQEAFNRALKRQLQKINDPVENNFLYEKLSLPLCQRVRGYFHMNPHMPLGTVCDQREINLLADAIAPFSDVQVIDDLTYYDLVLPGTKHKPGVFTQSTLKDRTLTLYSLSKQYALASVRAGIALGPKHLIKPICEDIFDSNNTPNIFTRDAFYGILNWPQKQRDEYLLETNKEYVMRRDLTLAFIQGKDKISKSSLEYIQRTFKDLHVSLDNQKSLLAGIPGLKAVVTPASGFFVIIDFSEYQGMYLGTTQLNQSRDFRNAFYRLSDVNTVPGEMMYMFDRPVLRFSYSISPKEIIDSFLRIKAVLAQCKPEPLSKKEIESIEKNFPNKPSKNAPEGPKLTRAPDRAPKLVQKVYLPQYAKLVERQSLRAKFRPTLSGMLPPKRQKGKRVVKATSIIDM